MDGLTQKNQKDASDKKFGTFIRTFGKGRGDTDFSVRDEESTIYYGYHGEVQGRQGQLAGAHPMAQYSGVGQDSGADGSITTQGDEGSIEREARIQAVHGQGWGKASGSGDQGY